MNDVEHKAEEHRRLVRVEKAAQRLVDAFSKDRDFILDEVVELRKALARPASHKFVVSRARGLCAVCTSTHK